MHRLKVVCLEVLYHPSKFLLSLKKHPAQLKCLFLYFLEKLTFRKPEIIITNF